MHYLLYYFILLPLSYMPFWFLYGFSNFVRFLVYHVFGYRRKVVLGNIEKSFPDRDKSFHQKVEKEFYVHLCDIIVESIKAFTISKRQVNKRIKHVNPEIFNPYFEKGKGVILAGGHYGNWEIFGVSIPLVMQHKTVALYTPIKNQFFNNKMKATRGKFGLDMFSITKVRELLKDKVNTEPTITIFGSDQSPRKAQKAFWMTFLNQETGVQFGAEKMAVEHQLPVAYAEILKPKRGYYEVKYSILFDDASKTEYGEVTKAHTRMLEGTIQREPAYWLWSHRRWKHQRPEDMPLHN